MNTNVQDNKKGLPPFASSSGFAKSRKRLRDPTDHEENIVQKQTVLTENSYNRQPFQPVTQSTPQNLGQLRICNQWPDHMYPPYQPQLSTQHLVNHSLPSSNFPMSSAPMQLTPFFAQNNTFNSGVYTDTLLSPTLNTSSTANDLFVNLPKQMASQNNNIKTKDDVAIGPKQTGGPNA
ncbi:hypothetical protein M3Y98_00273200 [Aphelenchoides besseyi]|nr:hypothetical protein M3Y98_00273200 [Aphelenchoides besseyi]KAI6200969.1 hypothetical protein M3Y96_00791200 [Aphelenchoides besseyi]